MHTYIHRNMLSQPNGLSQNGYYHPHRIHEDTGSESGSSLPNTTYLQ